MGKIKGHHIKVMADNLIEKKAIEFNEDLNQNKLKVKQYGLLEYSKKDRNKLAAQITNKIKRKNNPPQITAKPKNSYTRGQGGFSRDREERSKYA